MEMRLLLWDIDGTLITSGGAGDQALRVAVQRRFGNGATIDGIEIAGRTDRHIIASILRQQTGAAAPGAVDQLLEEYLRALTELLPHLDGRVLPGVPEILQRLEPKSERVLALLTGNVERGAKLKLERYDLWRYFNFGAFGDDHHDRNELGAFARDRAQKAQGLEFAGAQIDVIGDTGHDIVCGKAIGARTIAVATGSWSRAQLAEHAPDFLFDDFARSDDVIAQLGW